MHKISCDDSDLCYQALQQKLKGDGLPGEVIPVQCDLRKEDEILKMFDLIKTKYGGVDVCVNNAGVGTHSTLLEGTTEDWREMLEVKQLDGTSSFNNIAINVHILLSILTGFHQRHLAE